MIAGNRRPAPRKRKKSKDETKGMRLAKIESFTVLIEPMTIGIVFLLSNTSPAISPRSLSGEVAKRYTKNIEDEYTTSGPIP